MNEIRISRAALQRQLDQLTEQIRELQAQAKVYRQFLENKGFRDYQETNGQIPLHPENRYRGMSPADAIEALVSDEPGIVKKQLVDRLEKAVESEAENRRAVINSAIKRKLDGGQIVKRAGNRLYPVTSAELAEGANIIR